MNDKLDSGPSWEYMLALADTEPESGIEAGGVNAPEGLPVTGDFSGGADAREEPKTFEKTAWGHARRCCLASLFRAAFFAMLVVAFVVGCAADSAGPERGPLGKADSFGVCKAVGEMSCGGVSNGSCWCDADCLSYGDCCDDVVASCDDLECGDFVERASCGAQSACLWLQHDADFPEGTCIDRPASSSSTSGIPTFECRRHQHRSSRQPWTRKASQRCGSRPECPTSLRRRFTSFVSPTGPPQAIS